MIARDRISKARAVLIQDAPFFGVLASYLILVEAPEVETMATDAIHLFYAPAFVDSLTDAELRFVMAHEAMHCALNHMGRIGFRDLPEFNIAADLAINFELSRLGVGTMPADGWLDAAFAGMSAEEIYTARQQAKRQQQQPQPQQAGQQASAGQEGQQQQPGTADAGQGQPGTQQAATGAPKPGNGQEGQPGTQGQPDANGSATGAGKPGAGQGQPTGDKPGAHGGTFGGIMKPGAGTEAAAKELADTWQTRTRQAAAVAAKQPGKMPGFVQQLLGEISAPAVIDYREIFRDFIDSRVVTDYSFLTPNRRFMHAGLYLPGATVDGIEHLVCVIDSSGSMDQTMLENAGAEVIGALDDGKVQRLTLLWADTEVRHVQEFQKGDTIEGALRFHGGGGTRFDKALDWIAEHAPDATAIVYLTDADCSRWGSEPDCPILWAIHGDSRRFAERSKRAPFGRVEYVGRLE